MSSMLRKLKREREREQGVFEYRPNLGRFKKKTMWAHGMRFKTMAADTLDPVDRHSVYKGFG